MVIWFSVKVRYCEVFVVVGTYGVGCDRGQSSIHLASRPLVYLNELVSCASSNTEDL